MTEAAGDLLLVGGNILTMDGARTAAALAFHKRQNCARGGFEHAAK